VNSQLNEDFLACFGRLSEAAKSQSRKSYRLWKQNPAHPSLQFKRVHRVEEIYSCRISKGWRALGLLQGDTITWFWIGPHAEYESILKQW
jgi:hypothetical protein